MAASSLAKHLLSTRLLSGSLRTERMTLPAASHFVRAKSLRPGRPMTLPAASRRSLCTNAAHSDEPFYVVCGPCPKSQPLSPPVHHEWKARNARDGLHLRFYMPGVSQEGVKLLVLENELIAEGTKKDFEEEDDTVLRFRMPCPPEELFDVIAVKADLRNGMLRVFVPRNEEMRVKEQERTGVIHISVD
ncbi:heat shock 22 kDa protein mitochondrial [Phtheirospermum japonicum]|uniref:Heat shock 22 kDa protein mitochondrial n=1 Tax=Phtheirospermum japonicum TaxID=374723 RepID=A0A830BQA7_9LAMI|nr:heat shock 22 kDa protein mitochondrial [Phtheirospermum japonicum]